MNHTFTETEEWNRRRRELWLEEDVRIAMQIAINKYVLEGIGRGQSQWARMHGLNPHEVSDVLCQRRKPGPDILDVMGFERVTAYRRLYPSPDPLGE